MSSYDDIDPQDIDPETNRPYSNYSSPSLDTSFHDGEMDVDEEEDADRISRELGEIVAKVAAGEAWSAHKRRFKELEAELADLGDVEEETLSDQDRADDEADYRYQQYRDREMEKTWEREQ